MKRTLLFFLVCTIVLAPGAAWAQGGDPPPPDGVMRPPGDSQVVAQFGPLFRFLQLSEEQIQALLSWQRQRARELLPIQRSLGENARALLEAMSSDAPDPTLIGQLTLEGRRIRLEMQELVRSQREGAPIALSLSPDQIDQLEVLETSLRVYSIANLAATLNLVAGPATGLVGGVLSDSPIFVQQPGTGFGGFVGDPLISRDQVRERAEEFLMRFTGLETEVNRIGDNVDRVSLKLGLIPIRRTAAE